MPRIQKNPELNAYCICHGSQLGTRIQLAMCISCGSLSCLWWCKIEPRSSKQHVKDEYYMEEITKILKSNFISYYNNTN